MGKLLSLLARDDSNCCTPKSYDVFLDFENAAPTETEREIYDEVERVLRESDAVLDEIQCYKVGSRVLAFFFFVENGNLGIKLEGGDKSIVRC